MQHDLVSLTLSSNTNHVLYTLLLQIIIEKAVAPARARVKIWGSKLQPLVPSLEQFIHCTTAAPSALTEESEYPVTLTVSE